MAIDLHALAEIDVGLLPRVLVGTTAAVNIIVNQKSLSWLKKGCCLLLLLADELLVTLKKIYQ